MNILTLGTFQPQIGEGCFLAPGSQIIGQVVLSDHVNIWFNTVVRGDVAEIFIGNSTNIQDLCMLHVDEAVPLKIGQHVSVGHQVTLHGCTIEDGCLIGMGATLMNDVHVGRNCLVAAGSLLTPGKKFPEGVLIKGAPAKIERDLTAEEKENISNHYLSYLKYKNNYLKNLKASN